MNKYIPLHAHNSQGSIGDALMKLKDYVSKAKELQLPAIALTDHGTLTSMYAFNDLCLKNQVQPIIGCEVYEVRDRLTLNDESNSRKHLVLLAANNVGLKNLLSIVNNSYKEGFYRKPRTDMSYMREHGEGIIALSACIGAKIPQAILNNEPDEHILKMIQEYRDAFDEFYLEIQPGDFDEQIRVNQELLRFSRLTDTPLVVTNDIHYLEEDDCRLHDAHVKIARKQQLSDPQVYPDDCYWFMNYDRVVASFNDTIPLDILKEALLNTERIAAKVTTKIDESIYLPKFDVDSPIYTLSKRAFARLESIVDDIVDPDAYMSRLLYELETIEKLGFVDYFLMVEDFLNYARNRGIAVGPGRGSVGGSLVAYLLNITVADPVKYNLIFERFLSVHRTGLPDIDLDFDSTRREEMFAYAIEKYGKEHCALVSTFMMRKSRTAIRDTARILGLDVSIGDEAAKLIPTVYYDDDGEKQTDLSIPDSIRAVPALQEMYQEYPALFDMAERISDVPFATGIHAAGMLVSPIPLENIVPLIPTKKEIHATALPLSDVETAGLVKMDFLSLASLAVYENTQNDIGIKIDFDKMDYHDEKVWSLIGSKYTTGLFQISSKTYKSRMGRLKPRSISELAHCLALLRGPCISTGADMEYIEILEGKRQPDFIHPAYYNVTHETQGILIYQEQLMQLAVEFGFSLEDGYSLMKAFAKKKPEMIKKWKDTFAEKAAQHDADKQQIERMWNMIEVSGQYAFNQAHAVSYAILSYVSAYLKTYYPKEFLKNLLTNAFERDKKEEIQEAIEDCRRMGFKFLRPNVNASEWAFTIEDGKLRVGLCAIKGFGRIAAQEMISTRPHESFEGFMDIVAKNKCGKRAMIPAIFSNVFGSFGTPHEVYESFCTIRREEVLEDIKLQSKEIINTSAPLSRLEPVFLGGTFTTDPSNSMEETGFRELKKNDTIELEGLILSTKSHKTSSGTMSFVSLATGDGHLEVIVFPKVLTAHKKKIRKNNRLTIKAKKDGDYSCIALSVI